jgi:hypothetical protein
MSSRSLRSLLAAKQKKGILVVTKKNEREIMLNWQNLFYGQDKVNERGGKMTTRKLFGVSGGTKFRSLVRGKRFGSLDADLGSRYFCHLFEVVIKFQIFFRFGPEVQQKLRT